MSGRWVFVLALALAACAKQATPLRVTGSSTVHPFTQAVADVYAHGDPARPPVMVDAIGTGPGLQAFCAGTGTGTPDIADASRRIKRAEFDRCRAHGVGDIVEVRIGLDGIALADSNQGPKLQLTGADLYRALAAAPGGKPNTAKTWRDVDPKLPAIPIKLLGPAPGSGTRDEFLDLLLAPGCMDAVPGARDLQVKGDPAVFDRTCRQLRTDGAFVASGENYNATVQALAGDPQAIGVFGYSYLAQNASQLRGLPIDGSAPDNALIGTGKYPGARTLYLYVKWKSLKDRPEVKAFLDQYASMWNPGGSLAKKGLIPSSDDARKRAKQAIDDAEVLDPAAL